MAKLSLTPPPTFTALVKIPVAGGAAELTPTFKHRGRDELTAFLDNADKLDDVELILAMCSGWDLADTFNRENVAILTQMHAASPGAIFEKYIDEMTGRKARHV